MKAIYYTGAKVRLLSCTMLITIITTKPITKLQYKSAHSTQKNKRKSIERRVAINLMEDEGISVVQLGEFVTVIFR